MLFAEPGQRAGVGQDLLFGIARACARRGGRCRAGRRRTVSSRGSAADRTSRSRRSPTFSTSGSMYEACGAELRVDLLHLLLHALRLGDPRVLVGQHAGVDVQPRQLLVEPRLSSSASASVGGEEPSLPRNSRRLGDFGRNLLLLCPPCRLARIDIGQIPLVRIGHFRAVASCAVINTVMLTTAPAAMPIFRVTAISLRLPAALRASLYPSPTCLDVLCTRHGLSSTMTAARRYGWPICRLPSKARWPSASRSCATSCDARGLTFPLHFYLSDEWFTPDGATAIAIPFYLAHPRLEKLEEAQMLEVEGGEHEWCMRILRHEAGHAIDNAFRLRRRAAAARDLRLAREALSRVLHAEAVQQELRAAPRLVVRAEPPRRRLRRNVRRLADAEQRVAPALRRLAGAEEARIHGRADGLAARCAAAGREPRGSRSAADAAHRRCASTTGTSAVTTASTTRTSTTAICGACSPTRRSSPAHMTAAQFIARIRRQVRRVVAGWTGIYQYTIDQVLEDMIAPLPRAEAAPRRARRTGAPGVHRAAHRAGHELPAQRRASAVPVKKLRILALVHDHLVPPEDTTGIDILEAEWKMEYDVIETLREIGHEVRVLGIHDDLGGIRPTVGSLQAAHRLQPDGGVCRRHDLRSERRQLSRAAAAPLHRLQSARPDPRARQGALEEAARVSPHSGSRVHGGSAWPQGGAAQAAARSR